MNRVRIIVAAAIAAVAFGCVTAPRESGSFRIVSYNIHHGEDMDGVTDVRRAGWVIARESPRFAGVQEVDQKTARVNGADSCAILEKTTGLHATFAKAIEFGGGEYGNAVLSREIPLDVRRIPLPGSEPRVLLLCEFEDCWFGTKHLAVDSEEARLGSIEIIRKAVAACDPKPVFLSGDWNARPDSSVLKGLKEFVSILSSESEATFHGGQANDVERPNHDKCIDYIAVDAAHRGEYAVRERRVVQDRKTSDHMPIVLEIAGASADKAEDEFSIATFNVRCPGDKEDLRWYCRMPRVAQIVRDHDFDVFGVQEAVPGEMAILEEELPEFSTVGCGRNKDRGGEGMYIFYRRGRFDCLENGTFWLSETPDVPGSKYVGAGCPRTCTWALLRDRVTGRTFRYFNTHLDHISSKARWDGMQVLLRHGVRPAKARGETIFLTGDLNETLDETDDPKAIVELQGPRLAESAKENPIALVSTELKDTYGMSETPHVGTYKTFHGYKGTPRCRIDYIFATPDVKVRSHATLNDKPGGRFASDHYPVVATVGL